MNTIREIIEHAAMIEPNQIALRYHRDDVWQSCSYQDFLTQTKLYAEYLGSLGLRPRQSKVAILLENTPEWLILYVATVSIGCIVVPIDPKLTESEVAYILNDAEAELVISDEKHRMLLGSILSALPTVRNLLFSDGTGESCAGIPCETFEGAIDKAKAIEPRFYHDTSRCPTSKDLASIIYTSGTTGFPKGVMLSHGAFVYDAQGALESIGITVSTEDDFLLILPIFHAFAFTANFIIPILQQSTISFVRNLRTVGEDIRTLKPSVIMAVPLLAEKLYAKISEKLNASYLARVMLKLGLGKVVGKKVRASLGGRIRLFVVGGAKCPQEILTNFNKLGITMVEGYGLTEAAPIVSISPHSRFKIGTIGPKIAGIEVRIKNPDAHKVGELQVKGPIVMEGYYKNPEATEESFDNGWLCTGDLATIDSDGYISICGRKKALIVNREGKNIYPEEVEQYIAREPIILDLCVLGYRSGEDPGEKVGVIVTPNMEAITALYPDQTFDNDAIEKLLRAATHKGCQKIAAYKHPRKIVVKFDLLERTSTQKVRRCVYQDTLDE